jgi:hypothetical protein
VSMKLTSRATAWRSVALARSRSGGSPRCPGPVIRMAPKPSRLTVRSPPMPIVPAVVAVGCALMEDPLSNLLLVCGCCTALPAAGAAHPQHAGCLRARLPVGNAAPSSSSPAEPSSPDTTSSAVISAPASQSPRAAARSASTRPPQMPYLPIVRHWRIDSSRHSARTGHARGRSGPPTLAGRHPG